ncbi:MAG: IS630 family transposase [Bacteroidia bacterium]|nr:IS630 family transposase [Bacteroidia bacterium]
MMNKNNVAKLKNYLKKLKKQDLTPVTLRVIMRLKALIAYYKGFDLKNVSQCHDISEKSLKRWIKSFEAEGPEALNDEDRSGRPVRLPKECQEELKKKIEEDNQRVWVARHIYEYLFITYGVTYSVKYLPEFLNQLGLSYRKTVHILWKRNHEKRKEWIEAKIPEIYRAKIEDGWRIFYQDEVGFQTEGTLAHTWGKKGEKIEIKNYGRRGRVNLIGAFEAGTGIFYGILTSFKVNAMRFRRFICHLKREMRTDRIILICDNASFHKAEWFTEWAEKQKEWLKLEFLPAYSPDFNPIERLWKWIKREFTHNKCWPNKKALYRYLSGIIDGLDSFSDSLKTLMKKENERFEVIFDFYQMPNIPQFDANIQA